jgi:ADP-ribosylglycohydrolase
MSRTLCSLEGLAIGDALGELFFYRYHEAASLIQHGYLPPAPWLHTDDTEMAIAIVEVLKVFGAINQEALARRFAWHFEQDPDRGYGSMTRDQMLQIREGKNWRTVATAAFGGQGSMGNGGAMRAAPLGAYFAEDLPRLVTEAEASATVTHTHAEGIAGTIAVAVAAAAAWTLKDAPPKERPAKFFETVLAHTPHSRVRSGLEQAAQTPWNKDVRPVVHALGNGSLVTAPDTVPFAVWCAAHNLGKFSRALMTAISGGGDCDTNAAIAGGIVAVTTGRDAIPDLWRESREPLPFPELA